MTMARRHRARSSRAAARLVIGLLGGELAGAAIGVLVCAKSHAVPYARQGGEVRRDGTSEADDDADPAMTCGLLGMVAGAVAGLGAAMAYDALWAAPPTGGVLARDRRGA